MGGWCCSVFSERVRRTFTDSLTEPEEKVQGVKHELLTRLPKSGESCRPGVVRTTDTTTIMSVAWILETNEWIVIFNLSTVHSTQSSVSLLVTVKLLNDEYITSLACLSSWPDELRGVDSVLDICVFVSFNNGWVVLQKYVLISTESPKTGCGNQQAIRYK